jgi:cathepsin L
VTTAAVIEAHHEIYMKGTPAMFSPQQLLSCVSNPHHCGGAGGCQGATVELGLQWVMQNGLVQESELRYQAKDTPCADANQLAMANAGADGDAESERGESSAAYDFIEAHSAASIGLRGYEQLPSNQEEPVVRALVERGPVAISAAASRWYSYSSGVFDSCKKDSVVDHAVTLYGYGHEAKTRYWLIRNSWGKTWGEHGYIRLLRNSNEEEHCGIDNEPSKGVACDGGPAEVTVCGSCGMLYDSVVPHFGQRVAPASEPVATRRHKKQRSKIRTPARAAALEEEAATVVIGPDAVPSLVRRETQ